MTVKQNIQRNVEYLIIEETSDAFLFQAFVTHLITVGTLAEWDIFVVDSCSIHSNGENSELSDFLWDKYNIYMVHLPPYHPELNPTEFVFQHLVATLRANYARYQTSSESDFRNTLECTLNQFDLMLVWNMFRNCGYLKN